MVNRNDTVTFARQFDFDPPHLRGEFKVLGQSPIRDAYFIASKKLGTWVTGTRIYAELLPPG